MRPWIKLHRSMYSSRSTVADVAEELGVIVYTYWPAICMWAANDDTPGWFKGTVRGMRRELSDSTFTIADIQGLIQHLHNIRLIEVQGELDGDLLIEVANFGEFQVLTNADQKAIQRHRMRLQIDQPAPDLSGQLTNPSRDKTVDEEVDRETPLSDQPDEKPATDPDRDATAANVRMVFDAWKRSWGKTDRTLLDEKRRRRIRWAITTYGIKAVGDSLRGWRRDPWEGRPGHCDLTVLFRDSAQFEKGLELQGARVGSVASTSSRDLFDQLAREESGV